MFTVVKLGGVNGSGKTSVARALLSMTPFTPFPPQVKKPEGYIYKPTGAPEPRLVVLGSYENVCGGMDTISDKEDRFELLKSFCKKGNIVFFEGLLTGKTYGAMGAFLEEAERKGKGRAIWAFMDTPFDVCVERVLQRRRAAGNDAPFDPERTMRSTFNSCVRLEQKLRNGELPAPTKVLSLPYKKTPEKLAQLVLNTAMEVHYAR